MTSLQASAVQLVYQRLTAGGVSWWVDLLVVVAVICLYGWVVKSRSRGRFVTLLLNGGAVLAGLYLSLFTDTEWIATEWLPESQLFMVRFVGWSLLLMVSGRFCWTLFLLRDSDGFVPQGEQIELDDLKDSFVSNERVQALFYEATLSLFRSDSASDFAAYRDSLRDKGYDVSNIPFLANTWAMKQLKLVASGAPEWACHFDTFVWPASESTTEVPEPYQPSIRQAIVEYPNPVFYKGNSQTSQGVAVVYPYGEQRIAVFISLQSGETMNPIHAIQFEGAIETFIATRTSLQSTHIPHDIMGAGDENHGKQSDEGC